MNAAEWAALAAVCVMAVAFWPAVIAFILSLSPGWQLLAAAAGVGMLALWAFLGLLAAVVGLIGRR